MDKIINFSKRNLKEVLRDPIIYIFCLGFPLVMLILFQVIQKYTNGNTPMFELKSLLPAIIMFSFTFVMLVLSLSVSKDRQTFFLKRLYSSPMKSHHFILGYAFVGVTIGLAQIVICITSGYVIALITGQGFLGFSNILLLAVSQLPILLINIFLGILIGTLFNDKTAPGICSVFISVAGILGGCWMPIEQMGGFETFCRVLPFYPSVYIGRTISYLASFDKTCYLGLIPIFIFLTASIVLSFVIFKLKMTSDK